jgi:hypothetical protein
VLNFRIRRIYQLVAAVVLCTPALRADLFPLPNETNALGATPVFTRPKVTFHGLAGIQAIVSELHNRSRQSQPFHRAERKLAVRAPAPARVEMDGVAQPDSNTDYRAAVLAIQLIGIDRSTSFGKAQTSEVNDALWTLFSRPSFDPLAPRYVAQAQGSSQQAAPGINVWRPKPKDSPVRVPESALVSWLAFDALVLAALGFCFRRCFGSDWPG